MKKITLLISILFISSMINAQTIITICAYDSIDLNISSPAGVSTQWQQSLDNINFYDIPGALDSVYRISPVTNTRYYRCKLDGLGCDPFYSEVKQVWVFPAPNVYFLGLDSNYCSNSAPDTIIGVPAGGTFSGTGMIGNIFDPSIAGPGTFTIAYTYTDTNGCTRFVTFPTTVGTPPTTANAGPDILASSTTVTLGANTPLVGLGWWSILSGTGGSFAQPGTPNTSFTGTVNSVYTLRWAITSWSCPPSIDTVIVTMPTGPSLPSVSCGSPAYTMYVHPTDNGMNAWGCSGIISGANDDNNGTSNTSLIVQMCGQGTAAGVCDNLVAYGYSDWYLPSYNELECLRTNAATIGGFSTGAYWSSTEGSGILSSNAKYRTFPSGTSGHGSKSTSNRLRCVRKD